MRTSLEFARRVSPFPYGAQMALIRLRPMEDQRNFVRKYPVRGFRGSPSIISMAAQEENPACAKRRDAPASFFSLEWVGRRRFPKDSAIRLVSVSLFRSSISNETQSEYGEGAALPGFLGCVALRVVSEEICHLDGTFSSPIWAISAFVASGDCFALMILSLLFFFTARFWYLF